MKFELMPDTSIVPMTRKAFFGPTCDGDKIVHVAYYGTKLLGAFERRDHAERAIEREAKERGTPVRAFREH